MEVAVAGPSGSALETETRNEDLAFFDTTFGAAPGPLHRLRAAVRTFDPDVLHAMSTIPLVMAEPSVLLGRRRARPALFTSILVDPSSVMVYADGKHRPATTWFRNRLLRRIAPALDAVFAVSGTTSEALDGLGVRGRRVVTGSLLDLERLHREAESPIDLPEGRPRIGAAVGQLEPLKGVDHLVRAFADISRQHPDASLIVAGEGTERGALLALARELGIEDHVHLPGYVERSAPFIRALDVCVSPSLTEGLAGAVVEALALGVPVVATDVGGTSEAVIDGRTGFLVRPADPSALAEAIRCVLDDPPLAKRLAETGKAEVTERYGKGAGVEATWSEYRRAVDGATAVPETS